MRPHAHIPTLLTMVAVLAPAARAAEPPLAVSPGEPSRIARVEARCPTFHWGAVPGATAYELGVYRVHADRDEPTMELTRRLPGSVSGWTPSLGACLERGARYAWSIRALVDGEETEWSRPMPFEVAAAAEPTELATALEVVRRHLVETGAEGLSGAAVAGAGDDPPGPSRRPAAAAPGPAAVAPAELVIDGGVVAGSFTGDGSTLTGVAAATLQGSVPSDFAAASHPHSADQITSGRFKDERIPHGIARDSEVAAGYLPKGGGTLSGGLIVEPQELDLPASFLYQDDLVIESTDAVLGLYSSPTGSFGSAVVLGETKPVSGIGTDKWAMVRETTFGGGDLRFTFGTDSRYDQNPTMVELTDDGGLVMPGKFSVSSSGEITGRGIARAFGFVSFQGLGRSSPNILSSEYVNGEYHITMDPSICAQTGENPIGLVSTLGDLISPYLVSYRAFCEHDRLEVQSWRRDGFGWAKIATPFSFVIF